jgi:hypothetical protein
MTTRTFFVAAATAAIWLIGAGSARAGGAGADNGTFQNLVDNACAAVGVSNCPQLPTINQLVIENAALTGVAPSTIRTNQEAAIDAGTAFAGNQVVNNPLAFVSPSSKTGLPIVTQPANPVANAFLSATTSPDPNTSETGPTTLNLSFDFKRRTNPTFASGQDVGDLILPLAITNSGGNLLRQPMLTVQLRGAGGTAVTAQALGDLKGTGSPQTYSLDQLGITSSLDFSKGNEVLDLGIPLIGFDALVGNTFPPDDLFAPPQGFGFDAADGLFDGIDPIASFLDAGFADDNGDLVHAFHADLAIAFDGTTLLSAPLPASEPPALVLIAGALLALGLVRRRLPG